MRLNRIDFENRSGHTLSALLDLPADGMPNAYALFAHCFTCTKNLKAAVHISRALNRSGIAVLRFDFTGLGESGGDFSDTSFATNVTDLVDAAGYLADHHAAPQIVIGHSLGGAAVLQSASEMPSVRAVAVIGAPSDASHVLKHLTHAREEIETRGEAEVKLAGRPFRIRRQFVEDLESRPMSGIAAGLKRALMILHSPLDRTVGIQNAADIFTAARHPKSFVSLDKADHLLSDPADSGYAGTIIAAWAKRYIGLPAAQDGKRS
jgi:putative redox protein